MKNVFVPALHDVLLKVLTDPDHRSRRSNDMQEKVIKLVKLVTDGKKKNMYIYKIRS